MCWALNEWKISTEVLGGGSASEIISVNQHCSVPVPGIADAPAQSHWQVTDSLSSQYYLSQYLFDCIWLRFVA